MANQQYYYGENKNDGLAGWGTDTTAMKAGSITDAYDDGGWLGGGTIFDGAGGVEKGTPGMMTQAKGMFDGFDLGGLIDGLSGLAGMWMNYDALKSQKASARDSHNANAKMYNNKLARASDVQRSISGKKTVDNRTHVAGSTV